MLDLLGYVGAHAQEFLVSSFARLDYSIGPAGPVTLSGLAHVFVDLVALVFLGLEGFETASYRFVPIRRDDQIDVTADQFGVAVAEQFSGIDVGERHDAVAADFEDNRAHEVDERLVTRR